MATGDQTVSLVGSYATIALAIAAWDAGSTTLQTPDHFELIIEPVGFGTKGASRYHLIKIEISA